LHNYFYCFGEHNWYWLKLKKNEHLILKNRRKNPNGWNKIIKHEQIVFLLTTIQMHGLL